MLTGLIWSIEVAVLCLLIRTANKYRTKSYQVNISNLFTVTSWPLCFAEVALRDWL